MKTTTNRLNTFRTSAARIKRLDGTTLGKSFAKASDKSVYPTGLATRLKDRKVMRYMVEGNVINSYVGLISALKAENAPAVVLEDVMDAVEKGMDVVELLNGFANNSFQSFAFVKAFVSKYHVSRFITPKRKQYVALSGKLNIYNEQEYNGKLYPVVEVEYINQSESALAARISSNEELYVAKTPADVYELTTQDNPVAVKRLDLTNALFLEQYIKEEDGNPELIEAQKASINDGVLVRMPGTDEYVLYQLLLRTPSQARTVRATFVREGEQTPAQILASLGHTAKAYAKRKEDIYTVDVSKMQARPGLSGTSTVKSKVITDGLSNAVVKQLHGGMYEIKGQSRKILVAPDMDALVSHGSFRALDITGASEDNRASKFEEFQASIHSLTMTGFDGQALLDVSLAYVLKAEFGKLVSGVQFRLTPFGKGFGVFTPGVKALTGYDMILFDSCVKGDYRNLDLESYDIEFLIANFNKPAGKQKKETLAPYQVLNSVPVDADLLAGYLKEQMDKAVSILNAPEGIADYFNLDQLHEDLSNADTDVEFEEIQSQLFSNFHKVFMANPNFYQDVWMKSAALRLIKSIFDQYQYGNLHVEGGYKFMVQDPLLALELVVHNLNNPENVYTVVPSHMGLAPGVVVMTEEDGSGLMVDTKVSMHRMPKVDPSEGRIGRALFDKVYANAKKEHSFLFDNMVIFSVHDFEAFSMGGADFDGDKCLVIYNKEFVAACESKLMSPVLDMSFTRNEDGSVDFVSGCSFEDTSIVIPTFEYEGVTQNGWKLSFSDAEYSEELEEAINKFQKEFIIRTMEPNAIGLFTNYATVMLDAIRGLAYKIIAGVSAEEKVFIMQEIKKMNGYVSMLRLVQGWEIDKAKHGGAYASFIDLSFIEEVPTYCAVLKPNGEFKLTKSGQRIWLTPDWMAAPKGKEGVKTGSVMSRNADYAQAYYKHVEDAFDAINVEANTLHEQLSVVPMPDPSTIELLASMLKEVKAAYGKDIQEASLKLQSSKEVIFATTSANEAAGIVAKMDKAFNKEMKVITEKYTIMMHTTFSGYADYIANMDEVLGVIAYRLTYTDQVMKRNEQDKTPAKGLGFVWNVCTKQMIKVAEYVAGNQRETDISDLFYDAKLPASSIKVRAMFSNGSTKEAMGAMLAHPQVRSIAKVKEEVRDIYGVPTTMHVLYVGGHEFGVLFRESTLVFSGGKEYAVLIDEVEGKDSAKSVSLHFTKAHKIN